MLTIDREPLEHRRPTAWSLELEITAQADGFQRASRKFSLREGKTEEVTFVLDPKWGRPTICRP
jgi:hypothetical protein